jgi:biopolymer transport protein ExbD
MRIPSNADRGALRFDITPMIDVVFNLIIFFLVSSHFVRSEQAEAVDLAHATQEEQKNEIALPLVITIQPGQPPTVRGEALDNTQIDQLIQAGKLEQGERFEVHLRVDKTVPFERFEPIMLSCARAGVVFKFAVFLDEE